MQSIILMIFSGKTFSTNTITTFFELFKIISPKLAHDTKFNLMN